MRILFLTSFYPPHEIGGLSQMVRDLRKPLQLRGHETAILTSVHGVNGPIVEPDNVFRVLQLEADLQRYRPLSLLSYRQRREETLRQTQSAIASFRPDVVMVFETYNLTPGVPWTLEQRLPGRVVYYLASTMPYQPDLHTAYWRDPAGSKARTLGKQMLAPIALRPVRRDLERFKLQFKHVVCVSEAARQANAAALGRDPDTFTVIYNGVETDLFFPAQNENNAANWESGVKLLYAGNVVPHKGVHTVIEALALLRDSGVRTPVTLTIAGSGLESYEAALRDMIGRMGLGKTTHLLGRVPREEVPELMRRSDIFVLPSIWEEPLSRVMQEAMASKLAVVGTETGGSTEGLIHGETGLTFPAGDAAALAARLRQLIDDPELARKLAKAGHRMAREKFDFNRVVDEIEAYCQSVVDGAHTRAPGE